MSWHQLKACTADIAQFVHGIRILAICSCGGILQICQWYRVCDAGALRAEPLGHPLYLARSKHRLTRPGCGRDGRPHTAVIILVGNKTLAVCHQHWNDETDDMCGYTFFRWSERCDEPWSRYHYDDLKIYRPGPSATGGGERCGHCRDVVDRIR